ncbi:hypothetical protein Tco_0520921 [Tanacetum coccineum]
MGIPPKGTDGEYDAKVLERIWNYVQNEPINRPNDDANGPRRQASPSNHDAVISLPECPLDNADVDQSGPRQVPAPPQNILLVPVPLPQILKQRGSRGTNLILNVLKITSCIKLESCRNQDACFVSLLCYFLPWTLA